MKHTLVPIDFFCERIRILKPGALTTKCGWLEHADVFSCRCDHGTREETEAGFSVFGPSPSLFFTTHEQSHRRCNPYQGASLSPFYTTRVNVEALRRRSAAENQHSDMRRHAA